MQLRSYQARAIQMLYEWCSENHDGNPVLKIPGGGGKSIIIAELCRDALQAQPECRILMVVHSQILVKQNADELRKHWWGAPLGVYSAGLNKRITGEPITFAGIQSIRNRAAEIGHIDLCLVDEVHAISAEETGTYRKFMADLLAINPAMRIVGLSASPYRLGQGMVTDGKDALFSHIIEPVGIMELIQGGYLAPLRSKPSQYKLSTMGLHKNGGDYIASEMSERFNTDDNNNVIIPEIIARADGYKHWLIFCSDVNHANTVAECFRAHGVACGVLTSKTPKAEQRGVLQDFEGGKLRALCNVGMLTTGYNFPDLDCIVFLRMTLSPGLYEQMAMRGMRLKSHVDHALVLDFVGMIETHGPITNVNPPRKKGDNAGDPPMKMCDHCHEIVHISIMICPDCGAAFPAPEPEPLKLRNDDIMGVGGKEMKVGAWVWDVHTGYASGLEMLRVTYYTDDLSGRPITEYLTVAHDGYAGQKARRNVALIAQQAGVDLSKDEGLERAAQLLQLGTPPSTLTYYKNGKFFNVVGRSWNETRDA